MTNWIVDSSSFNHCGPSLLDHWESHFAVRFLLGHFRLSLLADEQQ